MEFNKYKNFRYINIEDRILQGTTIELKYSIYALNVSEEDYIEMEKREFAEMILQEILNKGE